MTEKWVDLDMVKTQLSHFFKESSDDLSKFGRTVNQVFEAFVLASIASWYKNHGWTVRVVNPPSEKSEGNTAFRLKFSTRGRPYNYTYIECLKGRRSIQIRHQLRVATKHHRTGKWPAANICLDVAVIESASDLDFFSTDDFLNNSNLITFAEAKHMSAFAELIAGFIGLVHEMLPNRLKCIRRGSWKKAEQDHPAPLLYVSGVLYHTAKGIKETIERRKYDIDIFSEVQHLSKAMPLPKKDAVVKKRKTKRHNRKEQG